MLFGYPKYKKNLLELFNALNGTNYEDENELEINTIEDTIYMGMKNDVSCIIQSNMAMYEQQSTWNPNMPLRGILYSARLFSKYIKTNELNIYSDKLIKIPTPQYYVFYNGMRKIGDKVILKLSDAFQHYRTKVSLNGQQQYLILMKVTMKNCYPSAKSYENMLYL